MLMMVPPSFCFIWRKPPAAEEGAAQIGVHHAIEGFGAGALDAPAAADAGVVDQKVEPPVPLDGLCDEALYLRLVGDVCLNRHSVPAIFPYLCGRFLARIFTSSRDDDGRAFFSECQRDRLADS